jgi:hypothetical protein
MRIGLGKSDEARKKALKAGFVKVSWAIRPVVRGKTIPVWIVLVVGGTPGQMPEIGVSFEHYGIVKTKQSSFTNCSFFFHRLIRVWTGSWMNWVIPLPTGPTSSSS